MNRTTMGIALVAFTQAACASGPDMFERRKRSFDLGEYQPRPAPEAHGSLFSAGRTLFDDERARAVGDVVVVRIEEADSAVHDSSNKLSREADVSLGIEGPADTAVPAVALSNLFGYRQSSGLEGKGRVARRGEIKAMLPVRVQQILPNGDLYVEGTKVVVISNEKRKLYVSGVVRTADIQPDGSVLSTRIADADITYITEGDAADQERVGWLGWLAKYIWPF